MGLSGGFLTLMGYLLVKLCYTKRIMQKGKKNDY